jgi:hypothetical protein
VIRIVEGHFVTCYAFPRLAERSNWSMHMRTQYLHLSAYFCDNCRGPVIAGSLGVRENEISKETDIREVGALCLSCGHRQHKPAEPGLTREFPPVQWELLNTIDPGHLATAFAEARKRAEVH